jgi:hypothetical protein
MHMSWLRHIGGRLESRYRYSVGVVYNTFPWPDADEKQHAKIANLAQGVLNSRAEFKTASLADLYDVDAMSPSLSRAHHELDLAVDKLYRKAAFGSDRERVEHLFGMYERHIMPQLAPVVPEGSGPAPRRRVNRSRLRRAG